MEPQVKFVAVGLSAMSRIHVGTTVALIIGALCMALPVLGFDEIRWTLRAPMILGLLIAAFGLHYQNRLAIVVGQVALWMLLAWTVVSMAPDHELAVLEQKSVSSAYLFARVAVLCGYTVSMLWLLGYLKPTRVDHADV